MISDEGYLAALRPHAEGRFGMDKAKLEAIYATTLAPLNYIRRECETFSGEVLGQNDLRYEPRGKRAPSAPAGRLGKRELGAVEALAGLDWEGRIIALG